MAPMLRERLERPVWLPFEGSVEEGVLVVRAGPPVTTVPVARG